MPDKRGRFRLTEAISSYVAAVERGERPDLEGLLAQYPDHQEELLALFENYDWMEQFAAPLRELARAARSPFNPRPFGKYQLLEILGQGGFGIVYKARHAQIGNLVALKAILAGPNATDADIQSFLTEARAIGGLDHRNIVPILDFDHHDGQYYFTMRLVNAGSLDKHQERFRGDLKAAIGLMIKVVRAVHHAHLNKIFHRDLKPANILVDDAGEPYVTDFGLAMRVEGREGILDSNSVYGTLPYMAPEQLSARPQHLTHAVDLWSLGVVLYELLAGKPPFEGSSDDEIIERIRKEKPPSLTGLNRNLPRALESICLKCLEKEPRQRYGSALALANDLERWLKGEDERLERLRKEARRRELRQELLYTSSAVADRVLMKLKDWSGAVVETANDPELTARWKDPKALQAYLDRVRRTFDDPARGLAPEGEKSPFESWILLDRRGVMIACSPHESIVGRDFSDREWYRGAIRHAGKRGLDAVHVSKVFLSVVTKNLHKFTLSMPVYGGGGAKAPVIGVVGASFTTDSDLGLSRLHDERHKVVVAGRGDVESGAVDSPGDCLVLVHPALRRGEEAVKIRAPGLRRFVPKPLQGELRAPEPGQVGVVVDGFEDPMAKRDERFKGLWWAGIAPVGNTPLVAIVQTRPDPSIEAEPEIVVGQLADLTGPTSSIGEPYVKGVQAYTDWLNAQGGIRGKKVRLVLVDYANKVSEALQIYARFKTVDRVLAIQGWGTGDTEALKEQVSRDRIPYFSASYSAHLADPRKAPYNFFVAADYSVQLRAGLQFLRDTWKKKKGRKPRVAFVYPDLPFGTSPIPAGKKYARELGFEIVGEELVGLNDLKAEAQIRSLKEKKPDFTWIGGSTPSTAAILKDARRLGLRTRFFVNTWGNDEGLVHSAGPAAEGVLGLQTSVVFGDDVPGMKAILEVTGGERRLIHYVRGWVSMLVLCEALWRAEEKGELTGPGIKKALETFRDFDPQGLTPPITYTAADHRPSLAVRVYEYTGGKMRPRATVNVERRAEWLGF